MKIHSSNNSQTLEIPVLAISGSLRAASSNTALLKAAAALAPEGLSIDLYEGLEKLPAFNPDLEQDKIPTVLGLRSQLNQARGVLFSTPEYAHGIPGSLKNLLDWVVGSGELVDKPIALLNAAPRSVYAQASLTETLTVMSARLVSDAAVTIPLLGKQVSSKEIISNLDMAHSIRQAMLAFQKAVEAFR